MKNKFAVAVAALYGAAALSVAPVSAQSHVEAAGHASADALRPGVGAPQALTLALPDAAAIQAAPALAPAAQAPATAALDSIPTDGTEFIAPAASALGDSGTLLAPASPVGAPAAHAASLDASHLSGVAIGQAVAAAADGSSMDGAVSAGDAAQTENQRAVDAFQKAYKAQDGEFDMGKSAIRPSLLPGALAAKTYKRLMVNAKTMNVSGSPVFGASKIDLNGSAVYAVYAEWGDEPQYEIDLFREDGSVIGGWFSVGGDGSWEIGKTGNMPDSAPAAGHLSALTAHAGAFSLVNLKSLSAAAKPAAQAAKASSNRRAPTPSSWHKFAPDEAATALKRIAVDGDDLEYRTRGGVMISLDAADYGALVKSGALELLKNPKGSQSDPDDDTGKQYWMPTYILQAPTNGPLAAAKLDTFIANAQAMSAKINKQVDQFHETIHAARIQSGYNAALAGIKAEVVKATPVVQQQIASYEANLAKWNAGTASFLKGQPADQQAFLKAVLGAVAPQVEGGLGIDIPTIQTIIQIDKLIYNEPAILSVDPGGINEGVRIGIDATEEVAVAGTMTGYVDALKAKLSANGIKLDTISFELYDQNLQGNVTTFLNNVLAPAIGKDNITGFGTTDSDGDANAWLEIRVRPAYVAQAKALLPKLQAQLVEYGFVNYPKNLIVASQDGPGAAVTGDENMPAGYSAAGYSYP